jgi:hypothetical protein
VECHSLHRLGVPVQAEQLPARRHLPQADGATLAAARQARPSGAKGELRNPQVEYALVAGRCHDIALLLGLEGTAQAQLVTWLLRAERVTLAEAAQQLAQTPETTRALLADLVQQGIVREVAENGSRAYELRMAFTRSHRLGDSLAAVIGQATSHPAHNTPAQPATQPPVVERLLDRLLSERGRFFLGLTPMVLVFLAAEALLITGNHSFTGALSFIGVVVIAMLGGIYPVLLLQAGRQKGEIAPGVVYRLIGNRVLLVIIYVVSLLGILLHGLVIWSEPLPRLLARLVAGVIMVITLRSWRHGAFAPRLTVLLRVQPGQDQPAHLSITVAGQPYPAAVELAYKDEAQPRILINQEIPRFSAVRQATIDLPAGVAQELKLWTFVLAPTGAATPLPALATVSAGAQTVQIDLNLTSGQVLLPLNRQPTQVTLTFLDE